MGLEVLGQISVARFCKQTISGVRVAAVKAEAAKGKLCSWISVCLAGAAVSAGCGEQMQGCIPERQLCHGEVPGILCHGQL